MLVPLHYACSHRREHHNSPTHLSKEDVIYPLTVKEIAQAQENDSVLKKLSKTDKYSTELVEDTRVLCKDGKMVTPKVLQRRAVSWNHRYLQHPGHTCLEEMLHAAMYWKGMRNTIRSHVKNCRTCQVKQSTQAQVWKTPYQACHHKRLVSFVCGSHWTIHSQR